jgi:acid phosphatase type 7
MKRISLLTLLVVFFALVGSTVGCGQVVGTGATIVPDHVTLTWTGDPSTTMTITWRTDVAVTSGVVEYAAGDTPSRDAKKVQAVAADFNTDLGASRLFTTTITGLSPKTKYSYRVGDGEHWSAAHSFLTAGPKVRGFKFIVFGDSQSSATGESPYGVWHDTIHKAYEANPNAKFTVNVGDLVDAGQSGAHWNAWFAAAAGVIDRIPEMPVTGNHEYMGGNGKPVYWMAQFTMPKNGPEGLKDQDYSYDYGPVHFVVLDSEQIGQGVLSTMQKWLDADLSSSKAAWKIVFFHKTPYEIKDGRVNKGIKEAFCSIIERDHADLVFNGHDHGVARTYPIKDGVLMQKPSQGTVYFIAGRSGNKKYNDLSKRAYNSYFYNPSDQPDYLVVDVKAKTLTVKAFKQDGGLLDTFSIDKAKDMTSDGAPPTGAASTPATN